MVEAASVVLRLPWAVEKWAERGWRKGRVDL